MLFAAPPPSLLAVAPFAWMTPDAFTALVLVVSLPAAFYVLRRLRLPVWWLLFPPLVEAFSVGSLNVLVLAALLSRGAWVGAVAKAYAALPMLLLGRFRQLAIAFAVVVLTFPFLPWAKFLGDNVGYVLGVQAGGGRSAWISPILLIPISIIALLAIGRRRAAWWSVPVLWPATQFHYSVFAMPARMTTLASAILALPVPGAPVVAVAVEAALEAVERRRASASGAGTPRDTSAGNAAATSGA